MGALTAAALVDLAWDTAAVCLAIALAGVGVGAMLQWLFPPYDLDD